MIVVITPPYRIPDEEVIVNSLFKNGLHLLHLRKPDAERVVYERFIQKIEPCFRERIVVHDHFALVEAYGLRGNGTRMSAYRATPLKRSRHCHSLPITCF